MKKIITILIVFISLQAMAQKPLAEVSRYEKLTTTERNLLSPELTNIWLIFNETNNQFEWYNGASWVALDTVLTKTQIEALGFVDGAHTVDTNTQLTNAEVLAITDPKYLLNTTDTFDGNLTTTGDAIIGGNVTAPSFTTSAVNGLYTSMTSNNLVFNRNGTSYIDNMTGGSSKIVFRVGTSRNSDMTINSSGTVEATNFIGNGSLLTDISYNDLEDKPTFTDTNTQLSDAEIAAFGYIKTDTNTQLSNAEVLAITDPKYLLNTTDTFNGDLTTTGNATFGGELTANTLSNDDEIHLGATNYIKIIENTDDEDLESGGAIEVVSKQNLKLSGAQTELIADSRDLAGTSNDAIIHLTTSANGTGIGIINTNANRIDATSTTLNIDDINVNRIYEDYSVSLSPTTLSNSQTYINKDLATNTTLTIPTGLDKQTWEIFVQGNQLTVAPASGVSLTIISNGQSNDGIIEHHHSAKLIQISVNSYALIKY